MPHSQKTRWMTCFTAIGVTSLVSILLGAERREHVKPPVSPKANVTASSPIDSGKYIVLISGCNDCHTAGYDQKQGKIPETEWLKGNILGWKGPWGTSYASNLRLAADRVSEDVWVTMCKNLNARPPMPNLSLHLMSEQDLRALYQYIKDLPGGKGEKAPDALPPGVEPKGPYVTFPEPPAE